MLGNTIAVALIVGLFVWFVVVPIVATVGLIWVVVARWHTLSLLEQVLLLYCAFHFLMVGARNILNYIITYTGNKGA